MARPRYPLTPALQAQIVAYVRAGGYPHVAAEAAGLPRTVFERWLQRGDAPAYRAFARAVREAHAQARLHAELTILTEKPLDWLKCGPGKDGSDNPGWTTPGKPPVASAKGPDREQMLSELFALMSECVQQLAACPDTRTALAAWLTERQASIPKK